MVMAQGKEYAGDISDQHGSQCVPPAIIRNEQAEGDLECCENSMLLPMQCSLFHMLNSRDVWPDECVHLMHRLVENKG